MFDKAYKNDQKVHFFVNLYTNICQRNMQKKTVDIIRLIICYSTELGKLNTVMIEFF